MRERLEMVKGVALGRDLAPTLRELASGVVASPRGLGGERPNIVDAIPVWWVAGHGKSAS